MPPLMHARACALGLAVAAFGCRVAPDTASPDAPEPDVAELVLVHGAVYTQDTAMPWAEALAISHGEIVAVGSVEHVLHHRGPETKVIELGGRMVLPGFHDAHVHPVTGGIEANQCDLNGAGSVEALHAAIRACALARPDAPWITGGGWDLTLFPAGNPSRAELDAIVPDRPVYLGSADGHSAWVNTRALAIAGVTRETPEPRHGRIERDGGGSPSGTLRESARGLVHRHAPALSPEDYVQGLRYGLALAHRHGITSFSEAEAEPEIVAAYATLAARGELTARVVLAQATDPERGPEQLDALALRRDALVHPRVRADALKIFADGVIEDRTAALLEPYLGTNDRGQPIWPPDRLRTFVTEADHRGFDVHVHAIGDLAVRITLDAFEAALASNGPRMRRHTIAHLELVHPDDLPRFRELGVFANVQPLWAYPDRYITDLTEPVLGPERSRWLYPLGSLFAHGATVVAGSDWSVSSIDPFAAIEVAVTRREPGAPSGPAWIPEEVARLADILAAYTRNGAVLHRQDDLCGTLEVGKRADLVVLDRNLFAVPPTALHRARVVMTMLDGEVVHRSGDLPL